jgi:hypothetical protein
MVPALKRKWDRGGFGSGTKTTEIMGKSPKELLDELRRRRLNPAYDQVDLYVVEAPGRPRRGIQIGELMRLSRQPPPESQES